MVIEMTKDACVERWERAIRERLDEKGVPYEFVVTDVRGNRVTGIAHDINTDIYALAIGNTDEEPAKVKFWGSYANLQKMGDVYVGTVEKPAGYAISEWVLDADGNVIRINPAGL